MYMRQEKKPKDDFKVGDLICDCRCRHLKVAEIITMKRCNNFLRWFTCLWWVPEWLMWFIRENCAWVKYQDTLILEDGSHCAVYGCGPEPAKENGDCHRCETCKAEIPCACPEFEIFN